MALALADGLGLAEVRCVVGALVRTVTDPTGAVLVGAVRAAEVGTTDAEGAVRDGAALVATADEGSGEGAAEEAAPDDAPVAIADVGAVAPVDGDGDEAVADDERPSSFTAAVMAPPPSTARSSTATTVTSRRAIATPTMLSERRRATPSGCRNRDRCHTPGRASAARSAMITAVWWAAVRDLQWRARRVVIATLTTALVFAMTLVLAGLVSSFTAEAHRTVKAFGADTWVVRDGVYGPFTTVSVLPLSAVDTIRHSPGVTDAAPVLIVHETVHVPHIADLNVAGYAAGALGEPRVATGRLPAAPGELAVDRTFAGAHLGQQIEVSGRAFTVVGLTRGLTINGGQPMAYGQLDDVEALVFPGAAVASAVLTRGVPTRLPPGYMARSVDDTATDTLRPVANAIQSLRTAELLMLAVAGLVIGSVIYLSALERQRDFAVLKATGTSSRSLFSSLAFQAVVLAVGAAVAGGFLAQALVPLFPLEFSISFGSSALMPAIAVVVGLLASIAGGRRATRVDPALAFGGP